MVSAKTSQSAQRVSTRTTGLSSASPVEATALTVKILGVNAKSANLATSSMKMTMMSASAPKEWRTLSTAARSLQENALMVNT